jgi:hypothetical protein
LCKPGDGRFTACAACRRGYPAWRSKPFDFLLNEFNRAETIPTTGWGRDRSISFDGTYEGPSHSGAPAEKVWVWDDLWCGKKSVVVFERGRVLHAPYGPVEHSISISLAPLSLIDWSTITFVETIEPKWHAAGIPWRPRRTLWLSYYTNWCPNCNEYLPPSHDKAPCGKYQRQRILDALHERQKQLAEREERCARAKISRAKKQAKQHELTQLANRLGDDWSSTHPEWETTNLYYEPDTFIGN